MKYIQNICSSLFLTLCVSGCGVKKEAPTPEVESEYQEESELNTDDIVFYELKNNTNNTNSTENLDLKSKSNDIPEKTEDTESKEKQNQKSDPLPPEVYEAIKRNSEIKKQEEAALKDIANTKKIEVIILNSLDESTNESTMTESDNTATIDNQ